MAKPLALVTGGSIGIGAATAVALARAGYHAVIGDVLAEEGRALARRIGEEEGAGTAEFMVMDVADSANVQAGIEAARTRHGRGFAVVVANAGIARCTPMAALTDAEWDRTHEVNLKGMMRVVRATLPDMVAAREGAIVCLSSIAGGVLGWAEHVPYAASKGGVVGLVRALALEVAAHGVRVNAVAPGLIRTAQSLDPDHSLGEAGLAAAAKAIPLGRVGAPEDIADVVVFLASDAARYLTGQLLTVDGGLTIAAGF